MIIQLEKDCCIFGWAAKTQDKSSGVILMFSGVCKEDFMSVFAGAQGDNMLPTTCHLRQLCF